MVIAILGSQISTLMPKNYKTTMITYIPLILLSYDISSVTIPLMIGYTASILICLLSKKGCKLLYPIRNTTFTGPENYLENDTKGDYAATTFLLVLAIICVSFSLYGSEIVNTLNETSNAEEYLEGLTHSEGNGYSYTNSYGQHININPSECVNKNITTTHYNNTTTTIITEYTPT